MRRMLLFPHFALLFSVLGMVVATLPMGSQARSTSGTVTSPPNEATGGQNVALASSAAFPFMDNFESGLGNWLVSGQDWALTEADFRSTSHSVTDSPNGNYPANANASLTLASLIDLSLTATPVLTFWQRFSSESARDYVRVEVSEDGGFAWTQIYSNSGDVRTWYQVQLDLSAYKSVPIKIRFRLTSEGDHQYDGWWLDDVAVEELDTTPIAFPFFDDFENGLGNWIVSGRDWTLSDLDYRSATHSITDSPTDSYPGGTYRPNTNASVTLNGAVDLSVAGVPALSFWHKYVTESNRDYILVEVSEDNGFTWAEIYRASGPVSTWSLTQLNLSAYKSVPIKIRFRLTSEGDHEYDGWWLDDVEITDATCCNTIPAEFDLRFIANVDQLDVDKYAITVQMNPAQEAFTLRHATLRFTYNDAGLHCPEGMDYQFHHFNSAPHYAYVDSSGPARIDVKIEYGGAPGNGTVVDDTVDVVTIYCTIKNPQLTSLLEWDAGNTTVFNDQVPFAQLTTGILENYNELLPVELIHFSATQAEGGAMLRWETMSEINNAGFEVQHRAGDDFTVLGFVGGRGTTSEPQSYTYRIEQLGLGRHIFRLKQIDYDGAFEYSPEVEVTIGMPGRFILEPAYPNPFNPVATLRFAVREATPVQVLLYNVLGQPVEVLYEGTPAEGQMQMLTIDGSRLSSGTYFVRLTGEGIFAVHRVVLLK